MTEKAAFMLKLSQTGNYKLASKILDELIAEGSAK